MSLPSEMTVTEISQPGGPEVLKTARRPLPVPGPGEILIRVHAAGVNRPDALQRAGAYPPPPGASDLPGLEVAGTVAALGEGAARWALGDRVTALAPGGGYAEYAVVPAGHALPVPKGFSWVEAASLPEVMFTVFYNVFTRSQLKAGEWFLVHGGSSGIGTAAIQLAKAFGAKVIATAGSAEKCAYCRDLGADVAIDYKTEDWAAKALDVTGGRGVDVILDMVAGPYIQQNIDILAMDGRYGFIAFLQGPKAEVNFNKVLRNRLTISGSTLRPQSVAQKDAIARDLESKVWPLLEAGKVRTHIHATFPLARAAEAHQLMESSAHLGKIMLTVAE